MVTNESQVSLINRETLYQRVHIIIKDEAFHKMFFLKVLVAAMFICTLKTAFLNLIREHVKKVFIEKELCALKHILKM